MALLIRPTNTCTGQRAEEIRELAAEEGIALSMSIEMILWFEDRGFVVDLFTGIAMKVSIERVTPSGIAVNHLLKPVTEDELEATVNGLFAGDCSECAADGALQTMIDAADEEAAWYEARLEELRDAMEDDAYHASGNW